ncbi:hypothetical protein BDW02DRAFT_605133 [Decorospora gaudefroyi]|uniref:Uncharacterized protein n=1 Tax=Decorospora gaudefroyi TaxID=184978 RepID=A0A6A5KFH8_9PLEO|nr:hypothetical protein BDW02DRAFT_605133 [Decorospora gaudefroyi]
MGLSTNQIGGIISGCAGAVIVAVCLLVIFTSHRNYFTFSFRPNPIPDIEAQSPNPFSHTSSVDFEEYGNLTVPFNRRPVPMALDIMTRVLLPTGLSARAKISNAPHLSLHLPHPISLTMPDDQTATSEADASAHALDIERNVIQTMAMAKKSMSREREAQEAERRDKATAFRARRRCKETLDWTMYAEDQGSSTQPQEVFVVGDEEDGDGEVTQEIEVAVDPLSAGFGSGKAMAALYRAI